MPARGSQGSASCLRSRLEPGPRARLACGGGHRDLFGSDATLARLRRVSPPEQAELEIQEPTRLRALDLPAPGIRQIERTSDVSGAAVCHVPEPPWIATMATTALGKVEHEAARGTLHLIGGLGAIPPKLRDHGAQSTNQILSPPASEGTSFTGVTGYQGPTRWRADGSSPPPKVDRR